MKAAIARLPPFFVRAASETLAAPSVPARRKSFRRYVDLNWLLANATLLCFLQNRGGRRGANARHTERTHPQKIIQCAHATRGFDLHAWRTMLPHQFQVRRGRSLVVVRAVRLFA